MKNLIISLSLIFTFACEKKINHSSNSSGETTTNSQSGAGGTSITNDSSSSSDTPSEFSHCTSPGVGSQANDYYTIHDIIAHGTPSQGGSVHWSSGTDLSLALNQADQNIFLTDSRFKVRLLLKPGPSSGSMDSYGSECKKMPAGYTKMNFKVGLRRSSGGGYFSIKSLKDIPVNGCSDVIEFTNLPQTNEPYVVEIYNAEWDFSCTDANEQEHSLAEQFCPYSHVYSQYCFELALQVSTDHTKDFE